MTKTVADENFEIIVNVYEKSDENRAIIVNVTMTMTKTQHSDDNDDENWLFLVNLTMTMTKTRSF